MYIYEAVVTRVIDADTFDVAVDLGFAIHFKCRIRIKDYDAPETWRPRNEAEATHGHNATEFAKTLVENKDVTIRSYKLGIYGRYTADVILPDGKDFATVMSEAGFDKQKVY